MAAVPSLPCPPYYPEDLLCAFSAKVVRTHLRVGIFYVRRLAPHIYVASCHHYTVHLKIDPRLQRTDVIRGIHQHLFGADAPGNLYIAFAGGGPWSVDEMLRKKS